MRRKVLVVDDSPIIRQAVTAALSKAGYEVLQAADGVEALEKVDGAPELALIVSDVNMPRMNGIELLENLRGRKSAIPVIMLTTEGQPELMRRAKAAGATGWLLKPFKPELLVAAATKLAPCTLEPAVP